MDLEYATKLAGLGFWLFPIKRGTKTPAHKGWQQEATRDAAILTHWTEYDLGIYTGKFGDDQALLIVDVDKKNGKDGDVSLVALELDGFEFPSTRCQHTPSGGRHLLYKTPAAVRQGVDVLGSGLDIRSRGGYVVAYEGDDAEIAEAPAWLVERCGVDQTERSTEPELTKSTPGAVSRALAYLDDHAPVAVEGASGDETTYKVACRLRDFGVERHTALDLMLFAWNNRCQPPWDPVDLRIKIDNAYKYAENKPGIADPKQEFGVWRGEPTHGFTLKHAKTTKPNRTRAWLVRNTIPMTGIGFLYGGWGEGKTFLGIDIGMAVARGEKWMNLKTRLGAVLFVSTEGTLENRVSAYLQEHKLVDAEIPFVFIEDSLNLYAAETDTTRLVAATAEVKDIYKTDVRLIVIDNLSNSMSGGDENTAKDTTLVRSRTSKLARDTGAFVLVIAHAGKNETGGIRGSSNLGGMADTILFAHSGVLLAEKVKEAEDGVKYPFALHSVDLGKDDEGDSITSCVVRPAVAKTVKEEFGLKSEAAERAWEAFENLTANDPARQVKKTEWKAEFSNLYSGSEYTRSFGRARKELVEKGLISEDSGWAWATAPRPRDVFEE